MSSGQFKPVVRYIHKLAAKQRDAESDRQLLDRFLVHKDQDAFAEIVHRYGNLVFGVCRRIVQDWQSAEDCFQAVFLILASRGASIRKSNSLPSWLYGVASRVARKARLKASKRRAREQSAATSIVREQAFDLEWRELRPHLDDAVAHLTSKYRIPFVLCYLQGLSVAEIARRLDEPRGTVAAKLSRARQQLQGRLARRGITLTASSLVLALSASTNSATAAPAALVTSTISIVGMVAAGKAATATGISPQTADLAKGVIRSMFVTRLKLGLGTLALLLTGTAAIGYHSMSSEQPQEFGQAWQRNIDKAVPVLPGATESVSYQLGFEIKQLNVNTGEKLVASPALRIEQKQEGRIEIATTTTDSLGVTIPVTFCCSGTVEPLPDGRVRVRLRVEKSQKRDHGDKGTHTVGVSRQLEQVISLGDVVFLPLEGLGIGEPSTRIHVTTGSLRTITVPIVEVPANKGNGRGR